MNGDRDEIAHGDDTPRPVGGVAGRRRRLAPLVVAVCVGLVLGGLAVRAWYEDQDRREVRLQASLFEFNQSAESVYVNLRLRNLGARPVTIDTARFERTGFDTVWNGLEESLRVRPDEWAEVVYELTADCYRDPREAATARLRVRTPDEGRRWVEVGVAYPGLAISFDPLSGREAVALPVIGDLRVRITRCDRIQDIGPQSLLFLRARLTSARDQLGTAGVSPT